MASMYRLSVFKNKHLNVEHLIDANHRLACQKEESIFQINKKIIETFFDCTLFLAKQPSEKYSRISIKLFCNKIQSAIRLIILIMIDHHLTQT